MSVWSRPGDGHLQAISRWVSIPLNSHVMKVGHILFINPLNTFYLRLYDVGHMVLLAREETCCRHYMGYSYRWRGGGGRGGGTIDMPMSTEGSGMPTM